MTLERLPLVGVLGSGEHEWRERSTPLGRALAERGVHLLTGGGGGVMAAVSRAFAAVPGRRGRIVGILPGAPEDGAPPPGYPNRWVEIAIRTHLPARGASGGDADSRNHLNVLSADVLVALPGAAGTRSEIELAVRYRRAIVVWPPAEAGPLPAGVERAEKLDEVLRFVDAALGRRNGALTAPGDGNDSD